MPHTARWCRAGPSHRLTALRDKPCSRHGRCLRTEKKAAFPAGGVGSHWGCLCWWGVAFWAVRMPKGLGWGGGAGVAGKAGHLGPSGSSRWQTLLPRRFRPHSPTPRACTSSATRAWQAKARLRAGPVRAQRHAIAFEFDDGKVAVSVASASGWYDRRTQACPVPVRPTGRVGSSLRELRASTNSPYRNSRRAGTSPAPTRPSAKWGAESRIWRKASKLFV